MNDLRGRVALVTGAGRRGGIGEAVARKLAQAGATVVITDLCAPPPADLPHPGIGQWEELKEIAAEIEALGSPALPLQVDVTDAASIQAMVGQGDAGFWPYRHPGQQRRRDLRPVAR